MAEFDSEHGQDEQAYVALCETKRAEWTLVSLSVSGAPSSAAYASVWAKRAEPEQEFFQGISAGRLNALYDSLTNDGWRPVILTATGAGGDAIFAGVFEKRPDEPKPNTRVDMAAGEWDEDTMAWKAKTFHYYCDRAQKKGQILRWADVYGTQEDPRYVGIWAHDPSKTRWNYRLGDLADLDRAYEPYTRGWVRPALVSFSDHGHFVSVWYDDAIGGWTFFRDLPEDAYLAEKANQKATNKLDPVRLLVGGPGNRFAVLFASDDRRLGSNWTVRATTPDGVKDGPLGGPLSGFDDYMRALMTHYNCRVGSLAIAREGKLVLANAYTWGYGGYPRTEPHSCFRIGSVSKPLTSMAVMKLLQDDPDRFPKGLDTSIQASGMLEVKQFDGSPPKDPNWSKVTIDHLLQQVAGSWPGAWNEYETYDARKSYNATATTKIGEGMPIPAEQVVSHVASFPDTDHPDPPAPTDPGTEGAVVYQNFNFLLLGLLVSRVAGEHYRNFVGSQILQPLGISPFEAVPTTVDGETEWANEVLYHAQVPYAVPSLVHEDRRLIHSAYFGNAFLGLPYGNWSMAPAAMARILAAFDLGPNHPVLTTDTVNLMWGSSHPTSPDNLRGWYRLELDDALVGKLKAYQHNGHITGCVSLALRREDGLCFAISMQEFGAGPDPAGIEQDPGLHAAVHGVALNKLANDVTKTVGWPADDLFPVVGMPSF